jgi:hypothetical protein
VIEISKWSDDESQPFGNLLPVMRALIAHDNLPRRGGFVISPSGWLCEMTSLIDFDFLNSTFVFPPTIELAADSGEILDRLSWCLLFDSRSPLVR